MATLLGRAYVYINGISYQAKNDTITISGVGVATDGVPVERAPVLSNTGIAGFTETVVNATFTGTLILTTDQGNMLTTLSNIEAGTIIVKTPNNKITYTLSNAFAMGNFTATAGNSEVPVTFYGDRWTEGNTI